mmetsp:Transcript_31420/g.53021  ORF Transcript_31420/g.53021 Transcript_31420/m.53021 type:complete len:212 (+) Transcript_31420:55-690(+)
MGDELDETEILHAANEAQDLLKEVGISQEFKATSINGDELYEVLSARPQELTLQQRQSIMNTLRSNMQAMYESAGWGWKEAEKSSEIFHLAARFLYIVNPSKSEEVLAFTVFRFEWDDDDEPEFPVLYCYELQVGDAFRKCGAGTFLMDKLRQISMHYHMRKILLTCFKFNTTALSFYKKVGFGIDSNSPSNYDNGTECYEILSDRPAKPL